MMSLRMMLMANGVKPVEDDFVILTTTESAGKSVIHSYVLTGNTITPKARVTEADNVRALSPYNPLNSFLRGDTLHTAPKGAVDAGVVVPYSAPGIEFDGTTIKQLRLASTDATSWHFERLTFDLAGNKTNTETFTITPAKDPTRSKLIWAANSASYTVHNVVAGGATVWNKDAAVVKSPLVAALGGNTYDAVYNTFWIAHNRMYAAGGQTKKYVACWDIDDPTFPSYVYALPANYGDALVFADMDGYIWAYLPHQIDAKLNKIVKFDQWLRPITEYYGDMSAAYNVIVSIGHAPKTAELPPLPETGVVSLLHFDGSSADETGLAWSDSSGVSYNTTNKKFGTSAAFFSGSAGPKIASAFSHSLAFGAGDFTIEMWLYVDPSAPGWSRVLETQLFNQDGGFDVSINGMIGGESGKLGFQQGKAGGGGDRLDTDVAFPKGVWTHYAVSRTSNVTMSFVNGVKQSKTITASGRPQDIFTNSNFMLGATLDGKNGYVGGIDELRITRGTAKYTATFTPPTAPFTYP